MTKNISSKTQNLTICGENVIKLDKNCSWKTYSYKIGNPKKEEKKIFLMVLIE